jgi:dTMP kinase
MDDALGQVRLLHHEFPGRLIAVDGSDGAGKTTLLDNLEHRLTGRGHQVVRTRQPTTEARELEAFRVYLFEPENRAAVDYRALLCMMIGDRLQHIHRVILPALQAGNIVLCDRYIYTQMVTTRTRGFDDEPWMYELYSHVLAPDVGIIVDADLDVAVRRISARTNAREAFFERDHVQRNLVEYRRMAELFDLDVLDTSNASAEEVTQQALAAIDRAAAQSAR